MYPQPVGILKCSNPDCGEEIAVFGDSASEVEGGEPRCVKCNSQMEFQPIVHRGPSVEAGLKKY